MRYDVAFVGYVGDASFVPELPRVNTNLAVAAVAERLAENIR